MGEIVAHVIVFFFNPTIEAQVRDTRCEETPRLLILAKMISLFGVLTETFN